MQRMRQGMLSGKIKINRKTGAGVVMVDICMMCTKKNGGMQEERLLMDILRIVRVYSESPAHGRESRQFSNIYNFHTNLSCPYGIHCPSLSHKETELNRLGDEINEHLTAFCMNAPVGDVKAVLHRCRGYFPNACYSISRILTYRSQKEREMNRVKE